MARHRERTYTNRIDRACRMYANKKIIFGAGDGSSLFWVLKVHFELEMKGALFPCLSSPSFYEFWFELLPCRLGFILRYHGSSRTKKSLNKCESDRRHNASFRYFMRNQPKKNYCDLSSWFPRLDNAPTDQPSRRHNSPCPSSMATSYHWDRLLGHRSYGRC